jgi:para-nitrobenzyl esterase
MTMHESARFVAKQVSAAGQPAWLYLRLCRESLRHKGTAEHVKELPFLFGTLDMPYDKAVTPKDCAMAEIFMGYIATFARTSDPNRGGLP